MRDFVVDHKTVIPLFNADVHVPLQLGIEDSEFAERLTGHMFPYPIPIGCGQQSQRYHSNEPIAAPLPPPETTIDLVPWNRSPTEASKRVELHFPLDQLPADFDLFDNLGPFALRSPAGGAGGFQTSTTVQTKRRATSILVIQFIQGFPREISSMVGSSNPYEVSLVDSLLDAMRLLTGHEPHQYKAFHLKDDRGTGVATKWPLVEIQGQPLCLTSLHMNDMKTLFLDIWRLRCACRTSKETSFQILRLALDYYYLSSTLTETRTIFMYLMIAFEALFKFPHEQSASAASSRLAKLVGRTKAEYNQIHTFVWDPDDDQGCCQLRNRIVHGRIVTVPPAVFWRFKELLRLALLRLIGLLMASRLDDADYYGSLNSYVQAEFREMPNT